MRMHAIITTRAMFRLLWHANVAARLFRTELFCAAHLEAECQLIRHVQNNRMCAISGARHKKTDRMPNSMIYQISL